MVKSTTTSEWGTAFLGRDEKSWGKDGIGDVPIDPDICYINNTIAGSNSNGTKQCPYYHDTIYNPTNDTIHLVIASFRDRLCPRTLYNLFTRSKNPYRIYARVLQQIQPNSNLLDDADCWDMLCQTYNNDGSRQNNDANHSSLRQQQQQQAPIKVEYRKLNANGRQFNCNDFRKNVEIVTIDSSLAKGPCDARSKLSELIEYDYRHSTDNMHRLQPVHVTDYCMQTDSHMDFSTNFDFELITMFHRATNDKAVLSTYVADMSQNNRNPVDVPHLCMIEYTTTWRNWGTKLLMNARKPKLTNLVWGAGMSFHKCHAELNVPYDPYLDNVFDGEETSRGIRFFTHGYDVYTPDKVLVTHDYHGHQSNPIIHTWGDGGHRKTLGQNDTVLQRHRQSKFDQVDWSYMDHITKMKGIVQPDGVERINIMMGTSTSQSSSSSSSSTSTIPNLTQLITNGRYGLGTIRTLDQAYEFAGFSPIDHKMHKNRCGNIKWVPYDNNNLYNENNKWGVDINIQRKIWNETESLLPLALPLPVSVPVTAPTTIVTTPVVAVASTSILLNRELLRNVIGSDGISSHEDLYLLFKLHTFGGWVLLLLFIIGSILNRNRVSLFSKRKQKNGKHVR